MIVCDSFAEGGVVLVKLVKSAQVGFPTPGFPIPVSGHTYGL